MTFPQEAFELSAWAQHVGVEDPLPALWRISMIDTDTIRNAGVNAWTQSHAARDEWREQFIARYVLSAEANDLLRRLSREGWDDAGYVAFEQHMLGIVDRMEELSIQCGVVGDQLVTIADAFEMHWVELCGLVVATVALIIGIVAFAGPFAALFTVGATAAAIVAAFDLLIIVAGFMAAVWMSVKPRLAVLAEATDRFDEIVPQV